MDRKAAFLEAVKDWYNEPEFENLTITPDETGIHVRFTVGYRCVYKFEPYYWL